MEFKELTKKDAQVQLASEMQKLLVTCISSATRESAAREMEGFERIFGRFVNEAGPSVEWDQIQSLDSEAVRIARL